MEMFDLHCDTITEGVKKGKALRESDMHISLHKLAKGDKWCQAFALFIEDDLRGEPAKQYFEDCYKEYCTQMQKNADLISHCETFAEIEQAFAEGKFTSVLAIEGGAALGGELAMVDRIYECGVRMMTLTWNGENEIASGSVTQNGISEFGKQAIARMEELGIIVDVSHLNDIGFAQLCQIATKPFIATHSNARALCNHSRNLTDAQIEEIIKRGGIVGMNYYHHFIKEGGNSTDINDLVAHIQHFLDLGGEDIVCLGSDFDGADIPDYIDSIDKVENLKAALRANGISEEVIEKIFYKNASNFFQKYL